MERTIRVTIGDKLSFDKHTTETVNTDNSVMGHIYISTIDLLSTISQVTLFKYIEYDNQIWNLYLIKPLGYSHHIDDAKEELVI